MNSVNELCHHGVKGQKWGVHRTRTRILKMKRSGIAKSGKKIDTSKYISDKPGIKIAYTEFFDWSELHRKTARHFIDNKGKIIFSADTGGVAVAAGKKYVNQQIDLTKYYKHPSELNIAYDYYN